MRFFELYFNSPLNKEEISTNDIFNISCFTPENINEKRLGYLSLVTELKNVLPQNANLLNELSLFIKENYYNLNIKSLPETSFKRALKKANSFLEELTKKGNVNWLGNLNIAALSLIFQKRGKFEINFTKNGSIKIFLIRHKQIIDIGKNLEHLEIDPYPLKIFSNIVSGKLFENDIVVILTKEVFDYFYEKNILENITRIYNYENFGSELKAILKKYEQEIKKISGVCLFCLLFKEEKNNEKDKNYLVSFKKEKEKFNFFKIIKYSFPYYKFFSFKKILSNKKLKLTFFKKKNKKNKASLFWLWEKKNLISFVLIVLLLLVGFFIFH